MDYSADIMSTASVPVRLLTRTVGTLTPDYLVFTTSSHEVLPLNCPLQFVFAPRLGSWLPTWSARQFWAIFRTSPTREHFWLVQPDRLIRHKVYHEFDFKRAEFPDHY